jgi:hypothetical protein
VHQSIAVNKATRSYAGQRKFSVVYGVDQDSAVGIATRYGMNGPGIEHRWVTIFSTPVQICPGSPSLLYSGYRFSFPGAKRWCRDVNHPSYSSVKVKERVELKFCSPSVLSLGVWGEFYVYITSLQSASYFTGLLMANDHISTRKEHLTFRELCIVIYILYEVIKTNEMHYFSNFILV